MTAPLFPGASQTALPMSIKGFMTFIIWWSSRPQPLHTPFLPLGSSGTWESQSSKRVRRKDGRREGRGGDFIKGNFYRAYLSGTDFNQGSCTTLQRSSAEGRARVGSREIRRVEGDALRWATDARVDVDGKATRFEIFCSKRGFWRAGKGEGRGARRELQPAVCQLAATH
ncbi:uncharacterized protein LY79DRAFT_8469 [Colletotrichum navitas]|uniref:Uncharacterized protein n=1 Tax=Colletotrichum navitas TaxID=681940 RepID=A0AAD8VCK0_9PEZI|nr:uncharacterized protein LY79DRAFT_8469 [Colletotrichum navitas]KAK1600141.1 hypothetical protein LY79DRAFT_8469 [Colletotrichum navitas]